MQFLPKFFDELEKTGIAYCVLRSYKKLPESTGGSDLDILIHQDSVEIFNRLFSDFIKKNKLKLVSVISDDKCPKYCISGENWGLQVDVFMGSVHFGKKEIIPASILFENTIDYKGVKVLNSKTAAVLAFLKELLNNKICSKKYIIELQNQVYSQNINSQLLSQFSNEFYHCINKHLHQLNETHCLKLYRISKKSFYRPKFTGINNKLRRFQQQPGYTIAFLGTDGSGKSTVINKITPILNEAFHNAVYYEHLRPNQFPSLARLIGRKEEFNGPVTNPHGSVSANYFGSLLRWSYYMLDYTLGFFLKIWPKKAIRSCVWIFDRYYYDYLIDPKRSCIKLPAWILKLGQFLIPEPDMIICLGTDAETIHNRKPELPLEEVKRQVEDLRKFCEGHKRAVWVDTGQYIEESTNEVMHTIINYMSHRFRNVQLS